MSVTTVDQLHLKLSVSCLNIEGGNVSRDKHESTKWGNLVVVLDRPIIDNVVFDTILQHARASKFPLLENAIIELNEPKFLVAWQALIAYYMRKYDNSETCKNFENLNRICIHIHQFPEFKGIVDLVKMFIVDAKRHYGLSIGVDVRTDNPFYSKQSYSYSNSNLSSSNLNINSITKPYCFVLSLSQAAGLDPRYEPGALLVPTAFIPFDGKTAFSSQRYVVINSLIEDIPIIFQDKSSVSKFNDNKSSEHNFSLAQLRNYKSPNPEKHHLPRHLVHNDFHLDVSILQINRIWNPTDANEKIAIK